MFALTVVPMADMVRTSGFHLVAVVLPCRVVDARSSCFARGTLRQCAWCVSAAFGAVCGVLHETTRGALEEPVCLFRLGQQSWMLLLHMLRVVLLGISAIEGLAGALASRAFVGDALQRQRPL
jgi:hypothetical protein